MASVTPRRQQAQVIRKQSSSTLSSTSTSSSASYASGLKYNKIVIRLLPPSLKEDEFLNQIANYYPYHASKILNFYYVKGSYPLKPFELPLYSRAYLNFYNANDLQEFLTFVKNKSFQDEKDSIVPIIEKALFHKMTDSRNKHIKNESDGVKDKLDDNPIYQKFLRFLNKEVEEFNLLKINNSTKTKKSSESSRKRDEIWKKHKEESKRKRKEKEKAKKDAKKEARKNGIFANGKDDIESKSKNPKIKINKDEGMYLKNLNSKGKSKIEGARYDLGSGNSKLKDDGRSDPSKKKKSKDQLKKKQHSSQASSALRDKSERPVKNPSMLQGSSETHTNQPTCINNFGNNDNT